MEKESFSKESDLLASKSTMSRDHLLAEIADLKKQILTLSENDRRYRLISNLSSDYVFEIKVDSKGLLSMEWITEGFLKQSGYTLDEIKTPSKWKTIIHPDDRKELGLFIKKVLDGSEAKLEARVHRKMGETKWMQISGAPEWDARRQRVAGIIGTATDITERKNAENAIQKSEEKFKALIESLPIGISISAPDNTMIAVNTTMWKGLGYSSKEDFLNRTAASFYYDPEDRIRYKETITKRGYVSDFEVRLKRKDESMFWASLTSVVQKNEDGTVFINTLRDITEKRRAEKAVLESERKYRGLYESIRDGIIETDMEGNIKACNQTFLDMLGYTNEEITKLTYMALTPEKWRQMNKEIIEKDVLINGYSSEYDKEYIRKDGTLLPVSLKVWLIMDEHREPKGMWAIVRDITERQQAINKINALNEELKENLKRLESANKELEAFSYSVSHDLRAPLRAIDGFCGCLADDYSSKLDDEGRALLDVVMKNTKKMGKLIDDLLDFARVGRKEMSLDTVDMEPLVRSVFEELISGNEIEPPDLALHSMPQAEANQPLIRQVYVNLIANAIKFTIHKKKRIIEVGGASGERESVYYVRDNGAGFEMKYANKLFGVFQRLHSEQEFKGTGIGLAIVERIVSRHGGRVWAEGEVGKGAAFYFTIPKKPPKNATSVG